MLRRGIEHRQEPPHHEIVELLLRLREALGRLKRRNDRKVVRDLAVVEDALVRLYPAALEYLACIQNIGPSLEHLKGLLDRWYVIFGQRARVGTRIGENLVLFIQRLREAEGIL